MADIGKAYALDDGGDVVGLQCQQAVEGGRDLGVALERFQTVGAMPVQGRCLRVGGDQGIDAGQRIEMATELEGGDKAGELDGWAHMLCRIVTKAQT